MHGTLLAHRSPQWVAQAGKNGLLAKLKVTVDNTGWWLKYWSQAALHVKVSDWLAPWYVIEVPYKTVPKSISIVKYYHEYTHNLPPEDTPTAVDRGHYAVANNFVYLSTLFIKQMSPDTAIIISGALDTWEQRFRRNEMSDSTVRMTGE